MIQDALAYAAQGLTVFPCTWITDGKCSCRDRLPSHWRNLGRRYFVAQKFLLGAPKMPITKGTAARSITAVIPCCFSKSHLAPAPLQFLPPKHPTTGNNRQIGERQTEGHAHHEAERLDPSRYDDDGPKHWRQKCRRRT